MIKISIHFYFRVNITHGRPNPHLNPHLNSHLPQQRPSSPRLYETALQKVSQMGDAVSRSTRENYLTALRSLRRFAGENLCVGDVSQTLLHSYERWLTGQGISRNTSSCYMRSLRAVLGKLTGADTEPLFKGVYTGRCTTEKRAVGEETVRRLKGLKLSAHSPLALARDLFLFSFYAQGMPFVDMAFLRRQQIARGQLVYHRHKTGTRISVALQPCMQTIISRYQAEGDYVFPLLHTADAQAAYNEYLTQLNWYNRALKKLAQQAGIKENLTSYTARHSWATAAYHANVELPVISKALGHSNPQTTLTYLREIDDHRLEAANRRIINMV